MQLSVGWHLSLRWVHLLCHPSYPRLFSSIFSSFSLSGPGSKHFYREREVSAESVPLSPQRSAAVPCCTLGARGNCLLSLHCAGKVIHHHLSRWWADVRYRGKQEKSSCHLTDINFLNKRKTENRKKNLPVLTQALLSTCKHTYEEQYLFFCQQIGVLTR